MKCWNCACENDLDTAQTCLRCGAGLSSRGGFFHRPWVMGVALGIVLLEAAAVLSLFALRGCR